MTRTALREHLTAQVFAALILKKAYVSRDPSEVDLCVKKCFDNDWGSFEEQLVDWALNS